MNRLKDVIMKADLEDVISDLETMKDDVDKNDTCTYFSFVSAIESLKEIKLYIDGDED